MSAASPGSRTRTPRSRRSSSTGRPTASPGEIHEHYPDLPLAKIHAAFAYYFEHQDEIDRRIADGEAWAREQWEANRESGAALHERLMARLPAQ